MALIQVNFFSSALMRTVPLNVVLPLDDQELALEADNEGELYLPQVPQGGYRTLYLLHGVFGNYTDWVSGTGVQRWAEDRGIAVVMPSGDNGFYVDQKATHDYYGRFVGEELVAVTRAMFPLSTRREDTFVGGLSMGGFGALRTGMRYPETFGRIVSLSGALLVDEFAGRTDDARPFHASRAFTDAVFGDASAVAGSENDPLWLASRMAGSMDVSELPPIYMACGLDDRLLEKNRAASRMLSDLGFAVTYEEGPGGHEWDFWDAYIRRALAWLDDDAV